MLYRFYKVFDYLYYETNETLLEKHQETAFCENWTISFHFPNYFRIFAIRNVI